MTESNLESLRTLRNWHYGKAVHFRERAEDVEKRVTSTAAKLDSPAMRAFERTASQFHAQANEHLRFVRILNEFFPATDRVM